MGKILGASVHILFAQAEGDSIVCTATYGISSDDIQVSRSLEIPLTAAQKNTIKNFANTVAIPQIKVKENIT